MKVHKQLNEILALVSEGEFHVTTVETRVLGKKIDSDLKKSYFNHNQISINLNIDIRKLPGKELKKKTSLVSSEIMDE